MKKKVINAIRTSTSVTLVLLVIALLCFNVIMCVKNVKTWVHGIIDLKLIGCFVVGAILMGVLVFVLNIILPENIDFDDAFGGTKPVKYDPDKDHDRDE